MAYYDDFPVTHLEPFTREELYPLSVREMVWFTQRAQTHQPPTVPEGERRELAAIVCHSARLRALIAARLAQEGGAPVEEPG